MAAVLSLPGSLPIEHPIFVERPQHHVHLVVAVAKERAAGDACRSPSRDGVRNADRPRICYRIISLDSIIFIARMAHAEHDHLPVRHSLHRRIAGAGTVGLRCARVLCLRQKICARRHPGWCYSLPVDSDCGRRTRARRISGSHRIRKGRSNRRRVDAGTRRARATDPRVIGRVTCAGGGQREDRAHHRG